MNWSLTRRRRIEEAQDGAAGDDTKPKPKIKKTNPKPKKTPKPKSTTTSKKREQEGGQDTEPVHEKAGPQPEHPGQACCSDQMPRQQHGWGGQVNI